LAAVLGDPVRHSLSPVIHNAAFGALGLDWSFVALEVAAIDLADAVRGVRALGLAGLSVTMPHKESIVALLDEVVGDATTLGAVNCVTNAGGRLIGHNTDGVGFVEALRSDADRDPAGMRCVVLGTGGAARAVALALAGGGAVDVALVGRDASRSAATAERLGGAVRSGTMVDLAAADLIVNATPVGMEAHPGTPLDPSGLRTGVVVVDLVYHPIETELIRECRSRGILATNGVAMLVHQAAAALELWTGSAAPLEAIRSAVDRHLAGG
jgi:shikimate dehydrogenase